MKPPNIGAKLLKRFSSVGTENITILQHAGWTKKDGTWTDLTPISIPLIDNEGKATHGAFFWGPIPPNTDFDPDITGDELRDAKWLWCLVAVSPGTPGSPPTARGPDRVHDNLTGKTYTIRMVPDLHRSQGGLYGALCVRAD